MNEILLLRNFFHIFFTHIKIDLIFFKIPKYDFLFLFYYYHKIDLIFYKSKTIFSQFLKNRSDIFSNQKILFSLISTDLNFSLQKANFFEVLKNRFDFSKPNSIFLQHRSKFFYFFYFF